MKPAFWSWHRNPLGFTFFGFFREGQESENLQEIPKVVLGGLGQRKPSSQPLGPNSNENGQGSTAPGEPSEPDLEFSCVGSDYPLIPPKDYEMSFVNAVKKQQWNRYKLFLWLQIETQGEWQGTQLFLPCNLETERKISTRSKYYRNWVVAAGRKPDRFDKKHMTTRVFQGKLFLARVVTVKKDQKNLPLPQELQYSKIEGLLKRLTD